MKKVILNLCAMFTFAAGWAQSVVVNSPPSLAGTYQFGTATGWGADLTSNIWTGDAVLMKDMGTSSSDGCDTVTNKAELAGKIVLVDRGTCNFSFKALQAQDWGGIACIIINNVPNGGVAGMGAGTYGASVTIPAVMLSYEDGQKIKAALLNGAVNISIGNIKFDHDLATNNRAGLCHAPYGTFPSGWIRNAGDYDFVPGASITNKGLNIEAGVSLNGKIAFTPNGGSAATFYDKTSDNSTVIEIDSTRDIFLESADLAGKVPGNKPGVGTITYTISAAQADNSPFDNTGVSQFYLSTDLLSKARLTTSGRDPLATNSYRRADGTNAEFVTGFNIPYGAGCKIDSVLFYMSISAPATLAGLTPEAILYGWDDADGDGGVTNAELSFLALGTYTFDGADTRTGAVVRIPLEDFATGDAGFTIPSNNFKVFVGVRYAGSELPFFGFDEGMDYLCNNAVLNAAGLLTDADAPYFGITGYDPNTGVPDVENAAFSFTNLNAGLSAVLVFSGNCLVDSKQLSEDEAQIAIFPNPVKDVFTATVKLKTPSSKLIYSIYDNSGKVLSQEVDRSGSDHYIAKFQTQNLPNGLYHLQIRTDNGLKQVPFEVMK